jgi:RNA polymerase sigma-70 factor (ECF subfamily)
MRLAVGEGIGAGEGGVLSAGSRPSAPDDATRAALLAGDRAAFEAFYATWFGRVHAFVRRRGVDRGEAEDLTQEVFVALLLGLGAYSGDGDFEAFVFGVARNVVRSHARGARRRAARPPAPPGDDPPTPEEQLRARRRLEALAEELRQIGAAQSDLFAQHFLHRVPVRELARRSGRSRHAVQASLWRVRRRLEAAGA